MKRRIALLTAFAGVFALHGEPVAETAAPCVYSFDSGGSPVAAVKDSNSEALNLAMCAGDTLAKVSPGGVETTLAPLASAGPYALSPSALDSGGVWTLVRTAQGGVVETATVTVRHSLYGTQGAGTTGSPATLVDAEELGDLVAAGTAGSGYTFTLEDGIPTLADRLALPAGYCIEAVADGVWRIVASSDGCVAKGPATGYVYNGTGTGSERKYTRRLDVLPSTTYSGDNWHMDASAASSLTIESPSGATTTYQLTGTGAQSVVLDEKGTWTFTLVSCGGTKSETATVNVQNPGLILIIT